MLQSNIFRLWCIWIILYLTKVNTCGCENWKEATACFGSDTPCSQYFLECEVGHRIVVGQLKYGTKFDQRCLYGISDCKSLAANVCCNYDPKDRLTDFTDINRTNVITNCEGKRNCSGWAPRITTLPSSTYVWMQYGCISDTRNNVVDMCAEELSVGREIFIQFNSLYSFNVPSATSTSTDCYCEVSSPSCSDHVTFTVIKMDLRAPLAPGANSVCSGMTVETTNKTYACESNVSRNGITSVYTGSPNEIFSLRNVPQTSPIGQQVLVLARSVLKMPLKVECLPPGKKPTETNFCKANTMPSTTQSSYPIDVSILSNIHTGTSARTSSTPTFSLTSVLTKGSIESSSASSAESSNMTSSMQSTAPWMQSTDTDINQTALPSAPTSTILTDTSSDVSSMSFTSTTTIATSISPKTVPSTLSTSSLSFNASIASNSVDLTSQTVSALILPSKIPFKPSNTLTALNISSKVVTSPSSLSTNNGTENWDISTTTTPTQTTTPITQTTIISQISISMNKSRISTASVITITPDNPEPQTRMTGSTVANVPVVSNSGSNVGTVTAAEPKESTPSVITETNDGGSNSGLIIGLTVAAVLVVIVLVGILVVCLWSRTKQKEAVRRNYVRNTNIFYSFPQDYEDMESTMSKNPDDSKERDYSEVEYAHPPTPTGASTNGHLVTQPLYGPVRFDSYRIKPPDMTTTTETNYDINFSQDNGQETISLYNGVERASSGDDISGSQKHVNGNKSVSFDPSTLYAKVCKEGKTKF